SLDDLRSPIMPVLEARMAIVRQITVPLPVFVFTLLTEGILAAVVVKSTMGPAQQFYSLLVMAVLALAAVLVAARSARGRVGEEPAAWREPLPARPDHTLEEIL